MSLIDIRLTNKYEGLRPMLVVRNKFKTEYEFRTDIIGRKTLVSYRNSLQKVCYNTVITKCRTFTTLNCTESLRKQGAKSFFKIQQRTYKKQEQSELKEEYVRKNSSIVRAIRNIENLVDMNYTPYTKFITFTFRENVTDLEFARSAWRSFMRAFKNTFGMPFKHLKVIENQKRGAIHFHCIVFIKDKIDFNKIRACWCKYGSVDIKLVKGGLDGVTRYICKYVEKTCKEERTYFKDERIFTCSQGLEKPQIIRCLCLGIDGLLDTIPGKVIYSRIYDLPNSCFHLSTGEIKKGYSLKFLNSPIDKPKICTII